MLKYGSSGKRRFKSVLCFFCFLQVLGTFSLPAALAETQRVKAVENEAVLRLQNDERVSLAGLELPEESYALLAVLIGGKEVEVVPESSLSAEGEVAAAYLYVQTSEIQLPFAAAVSASEKKVMINELLLAVGAAKVKSAAEFEKKNHFLSLEQQARESGQGLWSYADPVVTPSPSVSR